ncbi:hypothetical protein QYE76_032202 [Lolium multiflorum]|uniref:CCHC-type domain-containing protein n=1 Tax=Lolium multiflorum TaxID=4521 RepID=A0AAD8QV10_LOLMU|nr:hypothetical protein QYE76_032202 [Lolium multiflorum]
MENNLEVAGVEANDKVLFATHYSGTCTCLVDECRALNAGQMMTWADFKLKFSKMTVVEYRDKFLTLSRYAPDEIPPTRGRREWAQQYPEVSPQLKRRIRPQKQQATDTDVMPRFSEPEWRKPQARRPPQQQPQQQQLRPPPQQLRAPMRAPANNNNTNTAPRTGSNAVPVAPKDKATITCYECGVVGHYSNECPKRLAKIAAAPAQQQRRVSTGKKFTPTTPTTAAAASFT